MLVTLAGLTVVTLVRSERDLDDRPMARPVRTPLARDGIASRSLPISSNSSAGASHQAGSPWLLFRTDWSAVLWRVYQKMNENRLLAVAAGVVFYGLLAIFPAITAFVSLYGLMADRFDHPRAPFSLATRVLPQGALNILSEQLTRLTSHRTSALSVGFIGGLLVALWSANASAKAIMDALNVAYGETEKLQFFVRLNLVALAFTLGSIFALMLALGAVVIAPIVLSQLGLSGASETLHRASTRWPIVLGLVVLGLTMLYRYGPNLSDPRNGLGCSPGMSSPH